MPLTLLAALPPLLSHDLPFEVIKPVLDDLTLDWSGLNPIDVANNLLQGSTVHRLRSAAGGRAALVKDVCARLTWTSDDVAHVVPAILNPNSVDQPHRIVGLGMVTALTEHATPLDRTRMLRWALTRTDVASETLPRHETIITLLSWPQMLQADVWDDSPWSTVPSFAEFQRLVDHGFDVHGTLGSESVADAIRVRDPLSFESPSERQKIMNALPKVERTPEEALLVGMAQAKRWSDVIKVIKASNGLWVNVRFPDGDTVLHKAFDQDPEWAIKLIERPEAASASPDWAVDGHGDHLIWRTVWDVGSTKRVQDPNKPKEYGQQNKMDLRVPSFRERVAASGFADAWDAWPRFTPDRTAAAVAVLREIHRWALGNPGLTADSNHHDGRKYGWPNRNTAFESLVVQRPLATRALIDDPGFCTAMNQVAFERGSDSNGIRALSKVLDHHEEDLIGPLIDHEKGKPPAAYVTLQLVYTMVNAWNVLTLEAQAKVLLDEGSCWDVADEHLGHMRSSFKTPEVKSLWNTTLKAYWETLQLQRIATENQAPLNDGVRSRL